MKNLMILLIVLAVSASAWMEVLVEFDAPDDGPITGLAFGGGSLLAVSSGTNTFYRIQKDTGDILDSWAVSVPSGYTITGLGIDSDEPYVYIGMESSSGSLIKRYMTNGTFVDEEYMPEIESLKGLAIRWYTAGLGYIGTDSQMYSFDKMDMSIQNPFFDYNGIVANPADIGAEDYDMTEGNYWIANNTPGTDSVAVGVNSEGIPFLTMSSDIYNPYGSEPIPDANGLTCYHWGSVHYVWISSSDNMIRQVYYTYQSLENVTWGSIKSVF